MTLCVSLVQESFPASHSYGLPMNGYTTLVHQQFLKALRLVGLDSCFNILANLQTISLTEISTKIHFLDRLAFLYAAPWALHQDYQYLQGLHTNCQVKDLSKLRAWSACPVQEDSNAKRSNLIAVIAVWNVVHISSILSILNNCILFKKTLFMFIILFYRCYNSSS